MITLNRQHQTRMQCPNAGFTMIELMVVIAIIGILASIGIPHYTSWMLQGHLQEAKPYLMAIAAKERVYKAQRGSYYASTEEDGIEKDLGVTLKDSGNFCFLIRTSDFINGDTTGVDFEVWAVLNAKKDPLNTSVAVLPETTPSTTCTLATSKRVPGGWVAATNAGGTVIGGQGRVVVLRYPPTKSGLDTAARSGRSGVLLDWVDGISITDPLL